MVRRTILRKMMLRANWGTIFMLGVTSTNLFFYSKGYSTYRLTTPLFALLVIAGLICLYAAFNSYDSTLKKSGTYAERARGLKLRAAFFYAPLVLLFISSLWAPNPMTGYLIVLILTGPVLVLFALSTLRARLDALIQISAKKHAAETIGRKIYSDALNIGFASYLFIFVIMAAATMLVR